MAAARAAASASASGLVPGATGTPAASIAARAATLSPIASMASGAGPTQASPAPITRRANSALSARNPYPGCTACAPVTLAASSTRWTSRYDSAAGAGPSSTASSASRTCSAPASASECTATALIPSRWQVRITRTAISPRLATSTDSNTSRTSRRRRQVSDPIYVTGLAARSRPGAAEVSRPGGSRPRSPWSRSRRPPAAGRAPWPEAAAGPRRRRSSGRPAPGPPAPRRTCAGRASTRPGGCGSGPAGRWSSRRRGRGTPPRGPRRSLPREGRRSSRRFLLRRVHADQAAVPSVVPEQPLQAPPAPVQPGHHGADRRAHDLRDLLVGETRDVGRVDGQAEVLRQPLERVLDVGVGEMVERLHLRRAQPGRLVRLGGRELPVLDVLGGRLLRLPLTLAVGVDERVGEDPVEPGLEVGALLELVEGGEGLDERLLHQVLGVGRVAGHPHRRRVELVEERQRIPLEARTPLVSGLVLLRGLVRHRPSRRHGGISPGARGYAGSVRSSGGGVRLPLGPRTRVGPALGALGQCHGASNVVPPTSIPPRRVG